VTISRRIGIGYSIMAAACVLVVAWLWHHEFVEEPAEYAARGLGDLHKDTAVEFYTVCFLASVPVLLGIGWWWTRRLLAPLQALTQAAQRIESSNLRMPLPRSMNNDEVDTLAAVFTSMTGRLDASFQQIREFTLHASHELKTPLTVMRAQLETALRDGGALPAAQTEWIESLLDEVQRLSKIVDSLALLTKADAGLVTLECQPVCLGELVREAHEDALIMAQPHGLKVVMDACDDAQLTGDRHRLRQLLLILLDNAVKYNRPGGAIQLSLRARQDAIELRVTNDGASGVTPETQRHLFGRFVRGKNAAEKAEGCGLGLTIAQWIVQAHGGSIELLPEAGDRTTVLVRWPLARTPTPG